MLQSAISPHLYYIYGGWTVNVAIYGVQVKSGSGLGVVTSWCFWGGAEKLVRAIEDGSFSGTTSCGCNNKSTTRCLLPREREMEKIIYEN